jgi:general secretion pathway protein G
MAQSKKVSSRTQRGGGFTLLELIVVITIIGILSSIVVMSTRGAGPKARKTKAMADMRSIHSVAVALYNESGRWPESIEEMVNAKSEDGLPAIASLEKFPTDPWGNEYVYEVVDGQAVVRCLGNDGAEGGEGEAADLQIPEQEDTW